MTTNDEDYIIDTSITCSKEVAAAKLLGFMKGTRYPRLTAKIKGKTHDLYILLHNGEIDLGFILTYLRHQASKELAAVKADTSAGNLNEKEEALAKIDTLMEKSIIYLSEIDEELEKGTNSTLKIDTQRSKAFRATHITLASLDRWARQKYGIAILGDQEPHVSSEGRRTQPVMQETEEYLDSNEGSPGVREKNILVTLAFLVEAFSKQANNSGTRKFGEDEPNCKAIAVFAVEFH